MRSEIFASAKIVRFGVFTTVKTFKIKTTKITRFQIFMVVKILRFQGSED
jgi:hypothetical protein